MLGALSEISWLAVVVATLVGAFLGGVWFTLLFAKPYNAALGRQAVAGEKPGVLLIVGPLVCGLLTNTTSALLMRLLRIETVLDAVTFGGVVGLGYVVSSSVTTAINPNIPRPLSYSAVCGPYFLLSNLLSALILHAIG